MWKMWKSYNLFVKYNFLKNIDVENFV